MPTPMRDPRTTALLIPEEPDLDQVLVRPIARSVDEPLHNELPIPPRELHVGYGRDVEHYLQSGVWDHSAMLRNLASTGFSLGASDRILESGCAAGRILRNFRAHAETGEVWGVDINAAVIRWCQQRLSPPLRFCATTTFPHLPFESSYFRLIYCASVFTHIFDLDDMWLLELRRILAPGGRLYVTVCDEDTLRIVSDPAYWSEVMRGYVTLARATFPDLDEGWDVFTTNRLSHNQIVFHHSRHIATKWGMYMNVRGRFPQSHDYQTAVVLEKR